MGKLDPTQYEHYSRIDTVDPTGADDASEGFELGNEWLNSSTQTTFKLVGLPSPGNAAWKDTSPSDGANATVPGQIMYGTLLDYPFAGGTAKGEVQYIRLRLLAGTALSGGSTFIDTGGSGSRNIRMGLYDQVDPESEVQEPNNRVAQTAQTSTAGNGFTEAGWLGGDYEVPVTGFYWIALVVDSTTVKFAVTATHRADFLPVRHNDVGSAADLADPAGAVTNPVAAVAFMSLVLA